MSNPDDLEVGGVIAVDSNAQVQALYSGNTITPTADFQFMWNGAVLQFWNGTTSEVDAGLKAAMTAAGCPFSTP